MFPKISAIVCTYNGASMLPGALDSLINQSLPTDQYEVIVIDNASTDGTRAVVEEYARRSNILRYVYEPNQGLSRARNRGIKEARSEILAFIDDDAKASTKWLKTAVRCFEEVRPGPIAVGGPILPLYDAPKPDWFNDREGSFIVAESQRFLEPYEFFSGSNMIFHRRFFQIYGNFDPLLGVKGDILAFGEDRDIFQRVWKTENNHRALFYTPRLAVYHSVPDYKMSVRYQMKRAFYIGKDHFSSYPPKSLNRKIKALFVILCSIAIGSGAAFKHWRRWPGFRKWVMEEWKPVVKKAGHLAGLLGLNIQMKQR